MKTYIWFVSTYCIFCLFCVYGSHNLPLYLLPLVETFMEITWDMGVNTQYDEYLGTCEIPEGLQLVILDSCCSGVGFPPT